MPRFENETLSPQEIEKLKELARLARGDILKMTTLAGSGHPGGSMSSIDIYLILYSYAEISPAKLNYPERDRIIISHGHTSPGAYAVLGRLGYFDIEDALIGFRKINSPFEGHVVRNVPGIEWSTGNLGQGLSAGCGLAIASKIHNLNFHTFVAMSDGEQAKGQVGEARRFAIKYFLRNLTVIIDNNRLQISGWTSEVMPVNIKENYLSDGWEVIEIDGHDFQAIYKGLRYAIHNDRPTAIIARTTMGKGVSFMENNPEFHGRALTLEECNRALAELGVLNDLPHLIERRKRAIFKTTQQKKRSFKINLDTGQPLLYDKAVDNRKALGNALNDIARLNFSIKDRTPIVVFDCDLAESIRTRDFGQKYPQNFFEAGVQEHSTATIAGALSTQQVVTIFGDFGVFAIDETYNQQRLNDINATNLKIFATHLGLDVGPDGKTHHCIDYLGLLKNLYNFKIIIPADANQTDQVVRYALKQPGNFLIGVGRSKTEIITDETGKPFFGKNYRFVYGRAEVVRKGRDGAILTFGPLVSKAVEVHNLLKKRGHLIMVINLPTPTVLDNSVLKRAIATGMIITYEDHNAETGLGSLVAQYLIEKRVQIRFKKVGIRYYGLSDEREVLYRSQKLDVQSLVRVILNLLNKKRSG